MPVEIVGLRPFRGASCSIPASRSSADCVRCTPSVLRDVPSYSAMSSLRFPGAAASKIFARNPYRAGVRLPRAQRSNIVRTLSVQEHHRQRGGAYGHNLIRAFGEAHPGVTAPKAHLALRLVQVYDARQIKDLYALGRTVCQPLTKTHVATLLYVADENLRR